MAARTAKAIADLLAETLQQHRAATVDHEVHVRNAGTRQLMDEYETELVGRLHQALGAAFPDGNMPAGLGELIDAATHPEHGVDLVFEAGMLFGLMFTLFPAAAAGMAERYRQEGMLAHGDTAMDPGTAATLVARRLKAPVDPFEHAARNGVHRVTLDAIALAQSVTPTVGETLELLRRKVIGPGAAETALQQAGVQDAWIEALLALKVTPPSAELAVTAEVQNHLDPGRVKEIMEANGFDPANHDWWYETAGVPPGIEELIKLLRRKLISREFLVQAIRESRIKDKYIDAILETKRYVPPPRTVMAVFKQGGFDHARTLELLEENGLTPEDAAAYVAGAGAHHQTAVHTEAASLIMGAYEYRLYDRNQAKTALLSTRHGEGEAELMLEVADRKRAFRLQAEAIARVRAAYVGWRIDETAASGRLDALAIPSEARDDFMHTWTVEHELNRRHLTPTQIEGLFRRQKLDEAQALARLRAQGFTDEDAALLLDLATPAPRAPRK